ncbi:hypothetical protein MLD38_027580 [Melastoma candidum]|uniref:Uncharacterized protein n=1 Tax=Melastoma candidum TaxID=119954 RepID=A0ACB9P3Y0_9MYRT|nr:hypothetical protein MLD38_027580 [Melastoma candidum]
MSESEIGFVAVAVAGAGDDDDKSGNPGAVESSEEQDSGHLGGDRDSKEEVVDELTDALKEDVQAVRKDDFIVIDIRPRSSLNGILDQEKLCRICHLSSEQGSGANASKFADDGILAGNCTAELILLGCECRDDLGMAHRRCAETWFKLRRNRLCEICGKTAENVSGIRDNRFMEEWNNGRVPAGASTGSSEGNGCWNRPPLCNMLMACLVMAFILPWFIFRMNLF